MDYFEMIPQATKDMVHIFAAQGKAHGEIGFLTHLDEATVEQILAEPAAVELQAVIKTVNTTPEHE